MKTFKELNNNIRWYLISLLLYYGATNLSSIFVNIYLWKANQDVRDVAVYNLYYSIAIPLTFIVGGWIVKSIGPLPIYRIGILSDIIFYVLLLLLKTESVHYLWLIGVLKGAGTGFWALGMHVISFDYVKRDDLEVVFSYRNVFMKTAILIAPLITGVILKCLPSQRGYDVIFTCSLVLFTASVLSTLNIRNSKKYSRYQLLSVLKNRNANWMGIMASQAMVGVREITFSFLISLLLFIETNSELSVSGFTVIGGMVAIVSTYVVGRRISPANRKKILVISAVFLMLSIVGMTSNITIYSILFYVVISSGFEPLQSIVFNTMGFEVIKRNIRDESQQVEYIVAREIPMAIGRCLGLTAFVVSQDVLHNPTLLKGIIIAIGSAYVWVSVILCRIKEQGDMEPG